jgi:hypothetical protein
MEGGAVMGIYITETPSLVQLIDLFKAQTDSINSLWNILIVVVFASLGYVYKDPETRKDVRLKTIVTVGYLVFALGNLGALTKAVNTSQELSSILHSLQTDVEPRFVNLLSTYKTEEVWQLRIFHALLDGFVLLALWVPNLRRKRPDVPS